LAVVIAIVRIIIPPISLRISQPEKYAAAEPSKFATMEPATAVEMSRRAARASPHPLCDTSRRPDFARQRARPAILTSVAT
jgi:hypothetical protein